jgi:hypothetical protein
MIGNKAIHASSSLLAIATAQRYPHRSAVIRRSVASTACPNFYNKETISSPNIIWMIRWVGHEICRGESINSHILVRTPGGKTVLGTHRKVNIKILKE